MKTAQIHRLDRVDPGRRQALKEHHFGMASFHLDRLANPAGSVASMSLSLGEDGAIESVVGVEPEFVPAMLAELDRIRAELLRTLALRGDGLREMGVARTPDPSAGSNVVRLKPEAAGLR